ncbi:MAG: PKD domain-containing protein [bacterium]|nr:PKD domain-containing protein [bacterium]
MNKLTRNQIIAILVFGVVLLGGALVILNNRQGVEPTNVVTTESVDATVVAQNATEEPSSQPSPTPARETRSDDTDADGVPNDGTDQCPDVFGDAAFNGCPNPDTDGDGVDDSKEPAECVGAVDLGYGFDGNGCPNPAPAPVDSDNDGVTDDVDTCPAAGDAGFGLGSDGCPLPDPNTVNDDDGDGFVNASDTCPTQGDAGFGVDGNGCPIPPPDQPAVVRSCELQIVDNGNGNFTFNAINVQNVSVFTWDLAGVAASGQSVSRVFDATGEYPIQLTCADDLGNALPVVTGNVSFTAVVVTTATCEVTGTPNGNTLPVTVIWEAINTTGVDTFSWDFGGGDVQSGQSVTKVYDTAGVYNVSLTCTGPNGASVGPLSGSVDISTATASSSSLAANFTSNLPSGAFPQTLNLTSNVTGTNPAFTYAWVITGPNGYSNSSSEANPSFQLPEAGTYNIQLTVTDSATPTANTVIARGSITAVLDTPAPVVTIDAVPVSGASPLRVTFNAVNTGGPITTYTWNFAGGVVFSGDVNGAGPIEVDFTGSAGQIFNVTLDVLGPDGDGANALRQVVITGQGAAVKARFIYVKGNQVGANYQYCFTNVSDGTIQTIEWDFNNDGTFDSTEANPCTELAVGTHIVTLKVTGPGGETSTSQQLITVAQGAQPPVAAFIVSKTTVNVGETVTPTNQSTGQIDTYEWTWGDGTSSNTANPNHTYSAPGTYVINLKVTGPGGSSEAAAVTVEVVYASITCPISGSTTATYGNNTFSVSLNSNQLAGRTATVRWLVDGTEVSTSNSYVRSITTPGTTVINVEVLIDGSVVCSGSVSVTLTLNAANCTLSGSTTSLLNQSIKYELKSFTNLNGRTVVSYFWEFTPTGGVTVSYTTTTNNYTYAFSASGTYTVKVTGTLSDGTTCIKETTVTVSAEEYTCRFDRFPSSATQFVSNEYRVAISGNTSGKTFAYSWFANGNAVGTNNRSLNYAFNTSGQQTIKVEVRLAGNLICTVEQGIGVGVGSTTFCSMSGTFSSYLGQTLTYNMSVDSSKLGNRTVTGVEWFVNGTSTQNDGSYGFTNTWSAAGTYELKVVATASAGEPCIIIKTVTVSESSLECFNISGSGSIEQYDSKTYSIEVAPSGIVGVTYKWFVNDVEQAGSSKDFSYFFQTSGSVTLKAQVFLNGNLACEKTKTISVEADGFTCSIVSPANIFVDASSTFTVNLSDANGRTMGYQWYLNGTLVDSDNRFDYTFTQTTPQTVRLVVTPTRNGQPAGTACDVSFDFSARAQQSISVDADRYVIFVGESITFTTTTDIAPPYKWFVAGSQVGTTTTTTFTYTFNTEGDFTVEVEGVGVIRTQRASVNIKVVNYSEINVTFVANPWEALAPREICFVPTTDIDETLITEWLWTFHDGSTSTEKNPCFTYSTPGEYPVSLRVTDGRLVATSTNRVRLYAVVDANATFNVTPKGGLEYCFLPQVSAGVVVSEFEFGDGSTGTVTNNGEVCHTYQSEGNYIVRMKFSKDSQQGIVPRTVFITAGASESFNATAVCENNGNAVFTVTFNGQAMSENSSYPVSYSVNGSSTALGTISGLNAENRTAVFTVRQMSGNIVTFNVEGLGELTRTVECWDKSSVSVTGECLKGVITFYVENTGENAMSAPTPWVLTDANGATLTTGEIILAGRETKTLTFPEYAGQTVRLNVTQRPGHPGSSQPNALVENCLGKPVLTVSGICEYGTGRALFTVNVPADGADLSEPNGWTATGASTTTGFVGPLSAGTSSSSIAVLTDSNGNASLSVDGYEGATASVSGCYKLTLDSICWENESTYTMRVNNANTVAVSYTWAFGILANQGGNATPGQSTFSISGLTYPNGGVVSLYVAGILVDSEQLNDDLCTPPGVEPDYECVSNGVYSFTITGVIFGTGTYYVFDGFTQIATGTFVNTDLPLTFTVNSTSNNLFLDVEGQHVKVGYRPEEGCYEAPVIELTGYCEETNGNTYFSASLSGGTPIGALTYTIVDENGTTVETGPLADLLAGKTYTGSYSYLTLSVSGESDVVTVQPKTVSECYTAPEYYANVYCDEGETNGTFIVEITDNGYAPLPGDAFAITYEVLGAGDTVLVARTPYTGSYSETFTNQTSVTVNVLMGGFTLVATDTNDDCYKAPEYIGIAYCSEGSNGSYYFGASNIGGTPITTLATFVIVDQDGAEVLSGDVSELPVTITGVYTTLTMTLSTEEGIITEQADGISCYEAPELVPAGVCADQNGGFTFTITNIGGSVIEGVTLPTYVITDVNGTEVASGDVVLPFAPLSVTSENEPLTIRLSGGTGGIQDVEVTTTDDCFKEPELIGNVYCAEANGVFIISISNVGGAIVSTIPSYEVFIDGTSQGVVELTNAMLPFNEELPAGRYGNVVVQVSYGGEVVSEANNAECYKQPEYTPTGYCTEEGNGIFYFTLSQTGGGTPVDGGEPTFTITGDGFTTITGTMSELAGYMPIIGTYENGLTMSVTTDEGIITVEGDITIDCYEPPVWTPTAYCVEGQNGVFGFSIELVSGSPITGEEPTFTIDVVGNPTPAVTSGNISDLPSSITGRFSSVTLTIKTTEGYISAQAEPLTGCYEPPVYVPTVECTENNGEFVVTVVNTGGEPVLSSVTILVDFAFVNGGGTAADLIENAQLPFTRTYVGTYQYVGVSVSSDDVEPVSTTNDGCYEPPVYEPTGYCDEVENGTFFFEISNIGGTPITGALPQYVVEDENGNTVAFGSVKTLPTTVGPLVGEYGKLTLIVTFGEGSEGSITAERTDLNCYEPPIYVPELTCLGTNGVYGGQILNAGGEPMFTVATYQIVDNEGNILADGIVGELPFAVTSVTSISRKVTLSVFINGDTLVSYDDNEGCYVTEEETPTPTPTDTPEEPVCGETIETPEGEILINLDMCDPDPELGVTDWSPIEIGGAICPDWLVYHTDKTGDWELFRLGELPDGLTGPENLSQGVGPDVYDIAPSRSPDGLWIAFASTRDTEEGSRVKNWEIYVARVTGDDTRRITFNEFAMDLDPVWAPNGLKLAYETTTDNGDWEVRVFDLLTGENTIVTNNPANDINPSWSPDGSKLLIQSDREGGLWQIYEIDLGNGNAITKLSDGSGDDHDPMYSNDGTKIVFRSYRDDPRPETDRSREGAVYFMNVDGTGATRVSEIGGNATNHVFSPDDKLIAYQSNVVNGINDIFVYEIETGLTRLLTNNVGDPYQDVQDTAPTWYCESTLLVFTSSVDATDENPNNTNVFSVDALPIDAPPINADVDATRLTDDLEIDRDAQNSPSEENASRYGNVPPKWRP